MPQTLSAAREELLAMLHAMPDRQLEAFLISLCERVSDLYTISAELEHWQDKALLIDATVTLWKYLSDQNKTPVLRLRERLSRIAENSDQCRSVQSHFSEFSLTCLDGTIGFILDKSGAEIAVFAVFDLVKSEFAYRKYGYLDFGDDPRDMVLESEVMHDEMVAGELAIQNRHLELLRKSVDLWPETVSRIRRESSVHKLRVGISH
jgi:hypothetical protein